MDYNFEKNTITIFGKNEKADVLANRLSALSGEQLYSLFANRGISVPRRMNCMALISVINDRLKTLHASELSKDYFQRLKYYKEFSEVQLFNLFKTICNTKEHFKQYRVNLIHLILINFVGLNLTDGEIKYLKDLRKLPVEPFEEYFQYISSMCQEQENTFDGQDISLLKDMLVNSASNQEIMDLGRKYGIELSSNLKKSEFVEYIKYHLNSLGELTKNLEYEIDASTVAGLNSICRKYRIPMSSSMSKSELVTYLFYILSQCEIVKTSVRRIETEKRYEPLSFTVDLSLFRGFQRDDTKRIIHYYGEENDEFPPLETAVPEEVVVDTPLAEYSEASLPEEAIQEETSTTVADEEIAEEPAQEPIEESDEPLEEEPSKEEEENIPAVEAEAEPVAGNLPKDDLPEEPKEALPAEDSEKLPMDVVRENKNYGNDRLMKMTKGPAKKILIGIACLFFAAVVGFIIWALVR